MSEVHERLRRDGYVVLTNHPLVVGEPWAFVEALVGARPEMVEVQPIRPRPDGRSFASTRGFTPLHTDSQDYLGVSPGLQVMVCRRAATRGGETRLVDGFALLAQLATRDPALHAALTTTPRTQRFYFGDVVGPTVATKRGHRVWTHAPQPPTDAIGEALAHVLAVAPVIELAIATGEILLVDNHRMLHGRHAFDDDARELVRLLAWFPASEPPTPSADHRLQVVLELLTGVPPARLAAREGITEAELYAWRSRAFAAATRALVE
ncbi:MAG: TauD/TfdA family dioxygenase [Proteobacteria bacterium]|nr:TauD/TfdA family dioxygenase [Pseudomonadota bacterium]